MTSRLHKRSARRAALIVCGVVAGIVLCVIVSLALLVHVGRQDLLTAGGTVSADAAGEAAVSFGGKDYVRNGNVVAVALIGFDQRSEEVQQGRPGQADVLLILALNLDTGDARVIQVPRDSMVAVDQHLGEAYLGQKTEQICLAYSYGDGRETSCAYTLDALSRVLVGVPLAYYVALDMEGVGPINDALGGVELTPLATIPDSDIVEGQPMTLRGFDAEWYVRWRDREQLDSSLTRQQRQEQYFRALADALLRQMRSGNLPVLASVCQAAQPYVVTNMGAGEFLALGSTVVRHGLSADALAITSLTGTLEESNGYAAVYLDADATRKVVLDTFYQPVEAR